MVKFLGKDPSDRNIKWSEDQIQMYIVQESRRAGYCVTASMERGKRSKRTGARDRAMGMTPGVPDLIYRLPKGKKIEIELKTMSGKLSESQLKFHMIIGIGGLGHSIYTVYAENPLDGWEQVKLILGV